MLFPLLISLIGCNAYEHKIVYESDLVTITEYRQPRVHVCGIAWNAKAGAVVQVSDTVTYYVGDKKEWQKKYYGKEVCVSGRVKVRETVLKDTIRDIAYIPRREIILTPRIRLIRDKK